jgi:hypothetical protein
MKTSLFAAAALLSSVLYSGICDCERENTCCEPIYESCCDPCCGSAFVSIGGGYAWSFKTSIKTGPFWDPSPQGYRDDLNGSEFYFLGLGYHFPCCISASFELDYHPSFRYERFQTSTATQTLSFLGDKTRYFRVSNTAFFFNLFLNKNADCWCWNPCGCLQMAPFIGAGVGVSYNTVHDFHSVVPVEPSVPADLVRSIMVPYRTVDVAGQALIGITTKFGCNFSLDIGYRWFYGGEFRSNDYTVDSNNVDTTPDITQPWIGKLMANEIFVSLNYSL